MKNTDKKLAESILKDLGLIFERDGQLGLIEGISITSICTVAESYHQTKLAEVTDEDIETLEYEKAVMNYIQDGINYDCLAFTPDFKINYLEQFVFDTWFAAIEWERNRKKQKPSVTDKSNI